MEKDYNKEAKLFIKRIMLEEELTYIELSKQLTEAGFSYTTESLRMKVHRGRFDFAFVLQVCDVLKYNITIKKESQ